jgi:hypothetical protein
MALKRTILLTACALAVGACAPKQQPLAPTAPVTPDQLASIRASYQKLDPAARVGRVIAILPADHLAAVGDINLQGFRDGDAITFVDTQQRILTTGKVVAITHDALHVKYVSPAQTSREPAIGDIAVHLSSMPLYRPAP